MPVEIFDLGLVEFKTAWGFQKEIHSAVKNSGLSSALIFCQHYPVITLGRRANKRNILASKQELEIRGIRMYEIERGGDVTYHGPGQLITYPVFDLNSFKKDIHWFLRQLENIIIACLFDFGVKGQRLTGLTGVWVDNRKIASIGIAIRNWITFHGLSINVKKDDLDNFCLVRPCGMDTEMTTLENVSGRNFRIDEIKENLIRKFKTVSFLD